MSDGIAEVAAAGEELAAVPPKRKKPSSHSPTKRTLAEMRKRGYYAEVLERWIPYVKQRKDFAGFIDVLCIHRETGAIVGVQATSDDHVAERCTKIAEHENVGLIRKAGIRILVHGWKRRPTAMGGRWSVREVDVS